MLGNVKNINEQNVSDKRSKGNECTVVFITSFFVKLSINKRTAAPYLMLLYIHATTKHTIKMPSKHFYSHENISLKLNITLVREEKRSVCDATWYGCT